MASITDQQRVEIANWVEGYDSHGIYSKNEVFEEMEEWDIDLSAITVFTKSDTVNAMESRGLGGSMDDDINLNVWGYVLSGDLAQLLAGHSSKKMGRGFQHRENVEIIRGE